MIPRVSYTTLCSRLSSIGLVMSGKDSHKLAVVNPIGIYITPNNQNAALKPVHVPPSVPSVTLHSLAVTGNHRHTRPPKSKDVRYLGAREGGRQCQTPRTWRVPESHLCNPALRPLADLNEGDIRHYE